MGLYFLRRNLGTMDETKDIDVLEPSNSIFMSNYKCLLKEKRKLEKQLKEINYKLRKETLDDDLEFYFKQNKEYATMCINHLSKCLKIAEDIFTNGVSNKKIMSFYKHIYLLYEKGENF